MADDRPRKRGYARIERERRFALDALPASVDPEDYERLRDLYLEGTALRLRRIESPAGELILVKLGQKIPNPDDPDNPRHRQMTTLYLDPAEEPLLQSLPGSRSVKRRYELRDQGHTFCIDLYEEPAAARGTLVAEVECDTDEELERIAVPAWARREVTEDGAFSGFRLADS